MVNLIGIPKSCSNCGAHRGFAFRWAWSSDTAMFQLVCDECDHVELDRDPSTIARQLSEGGF